MRKRYVVLTLTVMAVFAGLFLSCGKSSGGGGASSKPLEVLMWTRDINDYANMEFYKQLEEQTGVKINLTTANGSEWNTKTNLMFASGEYADVLLRGGLDVEQYGVDQKILIPLEDVVEQHMPNYKALLARDPVVADYMVSSDGHTYYTGWQVPGFTRVETSLFINTAWLDKLGLPIPSTFAEFENTLRAFRDGGDLNGNGVKDELAFSGKALSWESVLRFLSFWGIVYEPDAHWLYINDDNRVDSYLRHPNFRIAMETLNRWYNEGLIDVETLTQEGNTFEAKVNSARIGTFWRMRMISMGTPDDVVAQYTCMLPVAALPGVTPQVHRYLGQIPSQGAYITVGCKDVERAARWIDTQYGFENTLNAYFGPYKEVIRDGKTFQHGWKFGDNGKVDFWSADETAPGMAALQFFTDAEYMEKFNLPPQRLEVININQMYIDAGVVEKNSGAILQFLVKMPPEDMIQRDLLKADIGRYAQEATAAFISKGVSNAGWNEYMATLQSLRIDEYVKLYQAAYDRYLAVLK